MSILIHVITQKLQTKVRLDNTTANMEIGASVEADASKPKQARMEEGEKPILEEDIREKQHVNVRRLNRILGIADKLKRSEADEDETDGVAEIVTEIEKEDVEPEFVARNTSRSGDAVSTKKSKAVQLWHRWHHLVSNRKLPPKADPHVVQIVVQQLVLRIGVWEYVIEYMDRTLHKG